MNLSEEVLMGVAGVAIALIGFSGVVTALGRRGSGKWSPAETLQLTTLVNPCIVTLYAAFVPIGLGLVTADAEIIWRASNAAVFVGHTSGFAAFLRRGSKDTILLTQKIWSAITVVVLLATLTSSLGLFRWHQFTFFLGLVLGIGVSLQNFYILLFPANGISSR
jgi:hypothetical protein